MRKLGVKLVLVGVLLHGCSNQSKTNTSYDASTNNPSSVVSSQGAPEREVSPEHRMPEPPKIKADDMERTGTGE